MLVVLATNNPNKLRQFRQILDLVDGHDVVRAVTLGDLGVHSDPEETDDTLLGNALIKLKAAYEALQPVRLPPDAWILAEDSGLFVDDLGGEPGVRSARWAGDHDDEANNRKLIRRLQQLAAVTGCPESSARYVATVAFTPAREWDPYVNSSTVAGYVTTQPRGQHGFAYDPYFRLPEGPSPAELEPEEWLPRSHRGRAMLMALERMLRHG